MFPKTWKIGHIRYLSVREKTDPTGNTPVGSNEALVACDSLIESLKAGIAVAELNVTAHIIDVLFPERPDTAETPTADDSAPEMRTGEEDDFITWLNNPSDDWGGIPLHTPSAGFYAVSKK